MHPQVRLPRPGNCPICNMKLIPVESLLDEQAQTVRQAGVETEEVVPRQLWKEIRTVGRLDYSENRVEDISARVGSRVERLFVDFTGVDVKKGDHLAELYSPALIVAQEELIAAVESSAQLPRSDRFAQRNLQSSRDKLRLWGLLPEQIEAIERSKQPQNSLTMYAPLGGTVIEKNVRVGQYVEEGTLLYRIAELDPIWLYLDIYESDVGWVQYGQPVEVSVEAYPGERFAGVVTFIDPYLSKETRAVKVRVNLKNPDRRLKPAMYASATVRVPLAGDGAPQPTGLEGKYICPMHPEIVRDADGECPICEMKLERVPTRRTGDASHEGQEEHEAGPRVDQKVLAVPASAILDTGTRKIAFRALEDGSFEMAELQLGPRSVANVDNRDGGLNYFPVLKGLKSGDRVVARGAFMIDSQRQIQGMPSLLYSEGQSAASLHSGHAGPPAAAPAHKH